MRLSQASILKNSKKNLVNKSLYHCIELRFFWYKILLLGL